MGAPGALQAQSQASSNPPPDPGSGGSVWFPQTRLFQAPRASPQEPGLRGAAVSTDLFRGDTGDAERPPPTVSDLRPGGTDLQGVVTLGDTYAVRRFGEGRSGVRVQVGVQVGVNARFRLATSANEYVASDWVVGVPVEWTRQALAGRLMVYHRSAHLGDEIIEGAGVSRIGFGHEGVSLLVGTAAAGPFRIYGGGSWIVRSETSGTLEDLGREDRDRWEVQGGIEAQRAVPGTTGGLAGFVAMDVLGAGRTGWRPQWAGLVGLSFRVGTRSGEVALRGLHGPSMHGEFFLTPETAWGLEFRLTR